MKRFLAVLTLCAAIVYSASSLAGQRIGPHLSLIGGCSFEVKGRCPVILIIKGSISKADAEAFRRILDQEATRTQKLIRPLLSIYSQGGDVEAAMQIGRDLRRTEGALDSMGPCYSACVLVAAGAVERLTFGIGIHRPYFADATTGSLTEADARYKKLMTDIRAYLHEMNMPDEVFEIMQSVAPDEIRELSEKDMHRLGFDDNDPAYKEVQIAAEARRYGLTSAEYRKRRAKIDAICGTDKEVVFNAVSRGGGSHEDARNRVGDAMNRKAECEEQTGAQIMWGADRETVELIEKTTRERCKVPVLNPGWDECAKNVGQAIKTGQSPTVPPAVAAPKLPPGWRWTDGPGSK